MENKVSIQYKVQSHEVDVLSRLKPFYLQTLLQEGGYAGSNFCGAGYDALRPLGLAWILNRIHISFEGVPMWGDDLKLVTWSRGKTGPLWHRNFQVFRGSDLLVQATTAWTVLDLANRTIFRGMPPFREDSHCEEDTLPFCTRIFVPDGLEMSSVGVHKPLFSEIDSNGHVNNCCYTEWAVDSLPFDYLKSHYLKDLEINYLAEVSPEMSVEFRLGREGDGDVWYFSGVCDDIVRFLVRLEFSE